VKIVIGTNTFGRYNRQNISVDSFVYLTKQFDCVDFVDVQFNNMISKYDVKCHDVLTRSSKDVISGSTKQLPFVNDILNHLSQIECDYFIYVNSDVILNPNIIKYIMNNNPDSFCCSRVDIADVTSFQQVIDKKVTALRYEIAGFDVFVFKRDWYLRNNDLFDDFLVGQPCWDQCYAMIVKLFAGGHKIGNKFPPYCFHIQHAPTWQTDTQAPERVYNHKIANKPLNRLTFNIFDKYLKSVLLRRTPAGAFMNIPEDEDRYESTFFTGYSK